MIRVVLVDDQYLVREGLRGLLERAEDITVVGEADNGHTGYRTHPRQPTAHQARRTGQVAARRLRLRSGTRHTRRQVLRTELTTSWSGGAGAS